MPYSEAEQCQTLMDGLPDSNVIALRSDHCSLISKAQKKFRRFGTVLPMSDRSAFA